jgi:transposase
MLNEGVHMTVRAIYRLEILTKVAEKTISQTAAAKLLNVSLRHMQRLYAAFRQNGAKILSSKKGRISNHQLKPDLENKIISVIHTPIYEGFGPTFMREKLQEYHKLFISVEKLRQIMIIEGIWKPKYKKKSPVVHQRRVRRNCYGELVQIDGSPHAWFETRGSTCTLIVFIDDATGHTYGRFFNSETTEAYMVTLKEYIKKYGKPIALYSDKYSVFKVNSPNALGNLTQFGRALKELDICRIYAHSPQAKGRVERMNSTLQDRLVKELRLANISTIEAANIFLDSFWDQLNKKFNVQPKNSDNMHKNLLPTENLDTILCIKEKRKLSSNLEIQYENTIYKIEPTNVTRRIFKAYIDVYARFDKSIISLEYKGRKLQFQQYGKEVDCGEILDSKEIDQFLKQKIPRKVPENHPWKSFHYNSRM